MILSRDKSLQNRTKLKRIPKIIADIKREVGVLEKAEFENRESDERGSAHADLSLIALFDSTKPGDTASSIASAIAAKHLPQFSLDTATEADSASAADSRGGAKWGDGKKVELDKAIPEKMRHHDASSRLWDRLSPEEQKILTRKIGDLTTEMIADSEALTKSEATRHPFIIKRDESGRVAFLVDPSRHLRMHFKYDGDSDKVIAMVREDTRTKASTTYVAVGGEGKRDWISVNSAGRRSEFVGDISVGKTGGHSIKLAVRDQVEKKEESKVEKKDSGVKSDKLTEVDLQKKRLQEAAEKSISNPAERAAYLRDMEKFRTAGKARGLSDKEIADFFKESTKLLSSKSEFVNGPERLKIAQQALKQAIDPTIIKQGNFNTCNVASIEVNMYSRCPSAAMKAITEASLTGKFTTADGKAVELSKSAFIARAGERSLASQIFQNLAVNTYWNEATRGPDKKSYPAGTIKYLHDAAPVTKDDTGQRVVATVGDKRVKLADHPSLPVDSFQEIYRRIAGKSPDVIAVTEGKDPRDLQGVANVDSAEKLHHRLAELSKKPGGLPIIMLVHTTNEPFWTDSGEGAAGGAGKSSDEAKKRKEMPGGWHVVTITGYDPVTKRVSVDNTWSDASDHVARSRMIPVDKAFHAMKLHPERLKELGYEAPKKEVAKK